VTTTRRLGVGKIRTESRALVVVRRIDVPWLLLGSSQDPAVAEPGDEVVVAVRRGGGGAVLVRPREELWIDAWIPASHRCWVPDVRGQLEVVGSAWRRALEELGASGLASAVPRPSADVDEATCCFLGHGAGEVVVDGAKLVGLAAWRGREGVLVQAAASRHRSDQLVDHLDATRLSGSVRRRLLEEVADLDGLGLAQVAPGDVAGLLAIELEAEVVVLDPEQS
jgi:lipoate-protein ligase A